MVNGKLPYLLVVAAAVMGAAVLLIVQPYSVTSPWHGYTKPARQYLEAAARHDSLGLRRQSLGGPAIQWALAAATSQPESLAQWARHAEAWSGNRWGDTAQVFLSIPTSGCHLILQFVGPVKNAKVERASSACLEPR